MHSHFWISFVLDLLLLFVFTAADDNPFEGHQTTESTVSSIYTPCQATSIATVDGALLLFPPSGQYGNNVYCMWYSALKVGRVSLQWYDVEYGSNCEYDRLEIQRSSGSVLSRICGKSNTPTDYTLITPGYLTFLFQSDHVVTKDGFFLTYQSEASRESCSLGYMKSLLVGTLEYPRYSGVYGNDVFCGWHIIANNSNQGITLEFTMMYIQSCSSCSCDALKVYTVDGDFLTSYCGSKLTKADFGYNALILVFTSDSSYVDSGFALKYSFKYLIPKGTYPNSGGTVESNTLLYIAVGIATPVGIILIVTVALLCRRARRKSPNRPQPNSAATQASPNQVQLQTMPSRAAIHSPPIVFPSAGNYMYRYAQPLFQPSVHAQAQPSAPPMADAPPAYEEIAKVPLPTTYL